MKYLLVFACVFFIVSCRSFGMMSVSDMLEFAGKKNLPTQEDFPNAGAVVLHEEVYDNLNLDSNWEVNVKSTHHEAILYFNDKAEDLITREIYLDPDRFLYSFYARTIKPNGEILEITKEDLRSTILKPDFVEYGDDQSVKFTFPGVEEGSILEFSYTVKETGLYWGNNWNIQSTIPKLYTKYSVEIPKIFFRYNYNWNYSPKNVDIPVPEIKKNITNQSSSKNASVIYYWEKRDIPALTIEPDMPPYQDIAQAVRVDLKYDDWNDLTKRYWALVQEYYNPDDEIFYKELSQDIIGDVTDDYSKIKRIFDYTQQSYHYLAVSIGESGIIPNNPKKIIENKYGDCKDMSVLNVVLLSSLGYDACLALVRTKDIGTKHTNIVSLDFNHAIARVEDSKGKVYWLDATGSSCPLGETYESLEGVKALIINNKGESKFEKIPKSKFSDNLLHRIVEYKINNDGSISGSANLIFKGNYNISIRSSLREENENDFYRIIERYVNSNTPDVSITNLTYDDPMEILDDFHVNFEFTKDKLGSKTSNLLIFKPNIFQIDPELDRYRDIKREHPLVFHSPSEIVDEVVVNFDNNVYEVETTGKSFFNSKSFSKFQINASSDIDGQIKIKRSYCIVKNYISPTSYNSFREVLKTIASSNEENIVLNKK